MARTFVEMGRDGGNEKEVNGKRMREQVHEAMSHCLRL